MANLYIRSISEIKTEINEKKEKINMLMAELSYLKSNTEKCFWRKLEEIQKFIRECEHLKGCATYGLSPLEVIERLELLLGQAKEIAIEHEGRSKTKLP